MSWKYPEVNFPTVADCTLPPQIEIYKHAVHNPIPWIQTSEARSTKVDLDCGSDNFKRVIFQSTKESFQNTLTPVPDLVQKLVTKSEQAHIQMGPQAAKPHDGLHIKLICKNLIFQKVKALV